MGYSKGPYARFTSLPVPPRPKLAAARNIDFARLEYTIDPVTGGYDHMPPTVQQVILAVLYGTTPRKFNTEQEREEQVKEIRNSLLSLTAAPAPKIQLLEVTVERNAPSSVVRRIKFRDLEAGNTTPVTVQLT